MKQIDTTGTDEIVCPHCGHEHGDSWEQSRDDGEFDCCECGRLFRYSRDISVTYSTFPIEGGEK